MTKHAYYPHPYTLIAIICTAFIVQGCGKDMRQAVGLDKPEIENTIKRVPPLTIPPEYTLKAPRSGNPPSQEQIEAYEKYQTRKIQDIKKKRQDEQRSQQ
ncbi:MAG: hypothetical protein GDA54_05235 [Alphaproteobacteria bacterium GM7ARS4]|nr:hypothetical protein [Alphaproteobacteria bacterium GM7ARS4]